jgi:dienelactone hydrolase
MRTTVIGMMLLACSRLAPAQQRDVRIPASDGHSLEATNYDPGRPGPAVILFRNCDQKRQANDTFARKLRDRGIHVVSYDYRDGLIAGRDWQGTRADDAKSVRDWLATNSAVDRARFGAVGGSCGVQIALQFAMAFAPHVKAAVILSGPHSDAQRAFVASTNAFAILAVASEGEGSEQYMKPIAEASRHPRSRLVVLKGLSHGMEMLTNDTGLEPEALRWLADRLLNAGKP